MTTKQLYLIPLLLMAWMVGCKQANEPVPVVPDPDPIADTTRHVALAREDQVAFLSLYASPDQLVGPDESSLADIVERTFAGDGLDASEDLCAAEL